MLDKILADHKARDACRLVEAATTIVALAPMLASESVRAAAAHLRGQAIGEPGERAVMLAIADYFEESVKD